MRVCLFLFIWILSEGLYGQVPEPTAYLSDADVDISPTLKLCDKFPEEDRNDCAVEYLFQYVIENLKYPKKAQKKKIEGRVYVQYIINEKGEMAEIKLVKDIGYGCGKEALRVVEGIVNDMGKWNPGVNDGENVRVLMTFPFTFKL